MKRLIVAVAAFALFAVSASEASAGAPKLCPDNSVCVWSKPGFKGDKQVISKAGSKNMSKKLNNKVSSIKNTRDLVVVVADAKDSGPGDARCVPGDTKIPDMGVTAFDFDNVTSSIFATKPGDPKILC